MFDAETDAKTLSRFWATSALLVPDFAIKSEQLENKTGNANGWIISIRCVLASVCGFVPAGVTFGRVPSSIDARPGTGVRYWYARPPPLYVCGTDGLDLNGKSRDRLWLRFRAFAAIAALKLGNGKGGGIDIDPQAIQASRDNAERNGVSRSAGAVLLPGNEAMKPTWSSLAHHGRPLRELAPLIQRTAR